MHEIAKDSSQDFNSKAIRDNEYPWGTQPQSFVGKCSRVQLTKVVSKHEPHGKTLMMHWRNNESCLFKLQEIMFI